jgi:hypothetical protein
MCRVASFLLVLIGVLSVRAGLTAVRAGPNDPASLANERTLFYCTYGLLTPVATYVAFFVNWGRTDKQKRNALICCALLTLPECGYFAYDLQHALRGGCSELERIVNAAVMLLLTGSVWLGTLLRGRRRLRIRDAEYYHPHCGGCGYDLTGNVSGVCPECGQPI